MRCNVRECSARQEHVRRVRTVNAHVKEHGIWEGTWDRTCAGVGVFIALFRYCARSCNGRSCRCVRGVLGMRASVQVCKCASVQVCMCACVHVCKCACVHVCTYTRNGSAMTCNVRIVRIVRMFRIVRIVCIGVLRWVLVTGTLTVLQHRARCTKTARLCVPDAHTMHMRKYDVPNAPAPMRTQCTCLIAYVNTYRCYRVHAHSAVT